MAQRFTSSATSINSSKLPAVFKKTPFTARIVMDYGCGKYTDHIKAFVNAGHREYLPYDPYNQPDIVNFESICRIGICREHRIPIDVICSNVLNVIDDNDTIDMICEHISEIVNETGGTGYVTVYEGNRSGTGRQTGSDQYQRNEPLRNYLRYFRNATIRNGMIIVKGGA